MKKLMFVLVVLALGCLILAGSVWSAGPPVPPDENSPPDDLARNPSRTGFPNPLESDRGWGGGSDKWDIVDGIRRYPVWYNGLAFTGGKRPYVEPCGWRQATIDFGEPTTFNRVMVWHHGLKGHVPNTYKIQYWDGANWVDVFSTTSGRDYLVYPADPPSNWWESFSTPTENTFDPVTSSKVRFALYNCDIVHGWIYEFEVYRDQPVPVPVDIKPTSCPNPLNVKGKGVLPIAILGTEDFDVGQIDPATVQLEGVSPLRWAWEDAATPFEPFVGKEDCFADCTEEGPDGYMDLTLKFKAQEVVAALGEVEDGDCLVLHLTGNLKEEYGGGTFVGEDVVWIKKKGK